MKELPAPAQRAVGCRTWAANGRTLQHPKALKDPRGQLPGRARQTRLDWWAGITVSHRLWFAKDVAGLWQLGAKECAREELAWQACHAPAASNTERDHAFHL